MSWEGGKRRRRERRGEEERGQEKGDKRGEHKEDSSNCTKHHSISQAPE